MRFLQRLLLVASLPICAVLAATQADTTLAQISTLTKRLEANRNALNKYKRGMVATVPIGTTAYELWSALKIGNDYLQGFSPFSPEDSNDTVKALDSFMQAGTETLEAYKQKEPSLHKSSAGFAIPIVLDAIYREVDQALSTMYNLVREEDKDSVSRVSARFRESWKAAFAAYSSDVTSDIGYTKNYQGLVDMVPSSLVSLF